MVIKKRKNLYMNWEILNTTAFWMQLVATTIIQIALSADNLIVMSLQASKLPDEKITKAINYGLLGSMVMRIGLLLGATSLISASSAVLFTVNWPWIAGEFDIKSLLFIFGGAFLFYKWLTSIKEKLYYKSGSLETTHAAHSEGRKFWRVVFMIIIVNLSFSLDSTFVVVGMTELVSIMIASVIVSLLVFLLFAQKLCKFIKRKPAFEALGLMLLLPIGWHLTQEGASDASMYLLGYQITQPSQIFLILLVVFVFIAGWVQDLIMVKNSSKWYASFKKLLYGRKPRWNVNAAFFVNHFFIFKNKTKLSLVIKSFIYINSCSIYIIYR